MVALRLLISFAAHKKCKLFIAYIDFSKAYDRVPRTRLIEALLELGCGLVMLTAIAMMYSNTAIILGLAVISASYGVRQGSPSSCFLFTLFVNKLIRKLKSRCEPDGFLGWLHCLMLMDDTVIFATSRDKLVMKLNILMDFCEHSGMIINRKKTKFMVINGTEEDMTPIVLRFIVIENCKKYVYLGSVFTQDGSIVSSLKEHCDEKESHLLKFVAFLAKNRDVPFLIKKQVFEAALTSALCYGCEAWFTRDVSSVRVMYLNAMRELLGVRKTTANDLCLLELNLPSLEARTRGYQKHAISKLIDSRQGMQDDPFAFVWNLVRDTRTPAVKYILSVLREEDPVGTDIQKRKEMLRITTRSKFVTYRSINPDMTLHPVYCDNTNAFKEHERIAFSRMRLSSHSLRIEMGRWSRTPRELRLCQCGLDIETEEHFLCFCNRFTDKRSALLNINFSSIKDFFESEPKGVLKFIYSVSEH